MAFSSAPGFWSVILPPGVESVAQQAVMGRLGNYGAADRGDTVCVFPEGQRKGVSIA
jgi:hypothetical protein